MSYQFPESVKTRCQRSTSLRHMSKRSRTSPTPLQRVEWRLPTAHNDVQMWPNPPPHVLRPFANRTDRHTEFVFELPIDQNLSLLEWRARWPLQNHEHQPADPSSGFAGECARGIQQDFQCSTRVVFMIDIRMPRKECVEQLVVLSCCGGMSHHKNGILSTWRSITRILVDQRTSFLRVSIA